MIYLWRIASDCPDNWIAVHDKETVDPTQFRKALPFDGVQPARFIIRERLSAVGEQDYLPNSAMLPLVSKAAGQRLQDSAGLSIQCVPAVVACVDGDLEATLINPLKAIPAVNWDGSKALFIPGTRQVMKFSKLQLVPGALAELDLARLDEFRSFVLASERVKRLLASSKLCEFVSPSDVRP